MTAETLADDDRDLRRLLATLGAAMVGSGQPVDEIEQELREVAVSLGASDVQLGVGPTGVHVALASGDPSTYQAVRGGLRLDQSGEVRLIRHRLVAGELGLSQATRLLIDVPKRPPAYPWWLTDAGFVAVGVGICMILQPGRANLLATAISSALVVALTHLVKWRPALAALLPTAAGFVVSLVVISAANLDLLDGALRTVLPALAVLLPGALIVTGLSELAAGAMIAGTARLLYGTVQLMLFAVGIGAAAALLQAPQGVLANVRVDDLGSWAAPVGLLLIGIGIALMECVPLRPLPWVFGVLALTFLVQYGGQSLAAPVFASFLGAITASLGASIAEFIDRELPRLVVFLPSFWLLVPGSLGLLGVSEVAVTGDGGALAGGQVPGVVLGIAVGLLVGSVAAKTFRVIGSSMRRVVRR